MLETVAAVPGMVGGMLLHLRSLRKFQQSGGWIKALLEEAENERMHLMTMVELVKPAWYERLLVLTVQGVFFNAFFGLYMISPKVAHRVVGYLEEEAIHSYTEYLKDIDSGKIENVPAPAIAIDYWRLPKDAKLKDVITVIRADEAHHRDVNHFASVSIKASHNSMFFIVPQFFNCNRFSINNSNHYDSYKLAQFVIKSSFLLISRSLIHVCLSRIFIIRERN